MRLYLSMMQVELYALVIETWNVRTLMHVGKLENIKSEMTTTNVNILELCETGRN